MKKALIALLAVLISVSCLCGCRSENKEKAECIVEKELNLFSFMPLSWSGEKVSFSLYGTMPSEGRASGPFSGYIRVKGPEKSIRTYRDLSYDWQDGILHLSNFGDDLDLFCCAYDPRTGDVVFLDYIWADNDEDENPEVIVHLDVGQSEAQERSIGARFQTIDGIYSAMYVSAQERLDAFAADPAFAGIDASYLAGCYEVTLEKSADVDAVIAQVEALDGVRDVRETSRFKPQNWRCMADVETAEEMKEKLSMLTPFHDIR